MATLADLLDPADRARLAALAHPGGDRDLAAEAREAARQSSGTGQVAWSIVSLVLSHTDSADCARGMISALVHDGATRSLAMACLAALTRDDTTEGTT